MNVGSADLGWAVFVAPYATYMAHPARDGFRVDRDPCVMRPLRSPPRMAGALRSGYNFAITPEMEEEHGGSQDHRADRNLEQELG